MTTLVNQITIPAPRHAVWQVLADLERLDRYDPGVRSSRLVDGSDGGAGTRAGLGVGAPAGPAAGPAIGLGAVRRCDLRPRGWFVERVVHWQPEQALAFDLVTCSLPVRSLRHDYTLTETGATGDGPGDATGSGHPATVVTQTMTYRLKYGVAGRLLDILVVRRQWDRGIKAFLDGLQRQVLSGASAPAGD
jgi:Polyketide cyclase / dehydrase and lipid transport